MIRQYLSQINGKCYRNKKKKISELNESLSFRRPLKPSIVVGSCGLVRLRQVAPIFDA